MYDSRAMTVDLKSKMKQEENWMLQNEKKILETELERQNREYEEKLKQQQLYRQKHQNDVLMQVNERDRQKRRELQEKMYEERAAKLAEIQYVRRIDN